MNDDPTLVVLDPVTAEGRLPLPLAVPGVTTAELIMAAVDRRDWETPRD
jgi:hypothetical protein